MDEQEKQEHTIVTSNGEEFDIPVEGSLGLLALGDIGLIAWRDKIRQVKQEMASRSQSAPKPQSDD